MTFGSAREDGPGAPQSAVYYTTNMMNENVLHLKKKSYMTTQTLQNAIANAINYSEERAARLESAIDNLKIRLYDLERVVYELTGGDDTRSEISIASTCKYLPRPYDTKPSG